ncbi:radical SAM protein [Methanofervidicoccus sp. A16]|uniref:radical SAM protein n=1 Tax=Methanofervidicoccus sp. A16 TaxID=2607662 RepID=UPI00118C8926|nr:radical SAM protein [Methanofervidicoccus sp. A16]AXI25762.1 radical SAM protein [Methanofervidicoccus sp. A16]
MKNLLIDFNEFKMITDVKLKGDTLNIEICKNYEISLPLDKILNHPYQLEDNKLLIEGKTTEYKLHSLKASILNLISLSISQGMKSKITGRKTYYICDPVPLLGHTAFGLIDRGTNIIQVRGLCGCNINCPFCSVDEGRYSKTRKNDYYVDMDHLLKWYLKIVEVKGNKHLEAHLDGQGEPTLYHPLPDLVQHLHEINSKGDGIVTIQTNGVGLTYKLIDELEEAGLHRINLSINAIDEKMSRGLAGSRSYDIKGILEIAEYIKNTKIHLLIAPILLPGINDEEFKRVIDYAVELERRSPQNTINPITGRKDPILGVQLCQIYQFGRRMKRMKLWNFKKFYKLLRNYEEEYRKKGIDIQLITPLSKAFGNHRRKRFPIPFKVNSKVKTKVILDGRIKGEVIGCAKDRLIQIINVENPEKWIGKEVKVRILSTKDGIFVGELSH